MRGLAPHKRPLLTFSVVGIVMAFLAGWLEAGELLAGVVAAALIAVAFGAAFAFLARLLAQAPPSLDRARSRAADAHASTATSTHDVRRDRDGG